MLADTAAVLLGVAAVVSAIGGGVVSPILAFLARRHAKLAKELTKVASVEIRDQSVRVDAIAEHLAESQRQGTEVNKELVDVMRDLRRKNG